MQLSEPVQLAVRFGLAATESWGAVNKTKIASFGFRFSFFDGIHKGNEIGTWSATGAFAQID
jgi:hypothetical protein